MKKIILILILLVNGYAAQPYWGGLDASNQSYLFGKNISDCRFWAYTNALIDIEHQLNVKVSIESKTEENEPDGSFSKYFESNIEEGAIYEASKGKIQLYSTLSTIEESSGDKTGREAFLEVGLMYEDGMYAIDYEAEWGETEGLGDAEQYGKDACISMMNCSI